MAETIPYDVSITPRSGQVSSVTIAEGARFNVILNATNKQTVLDLITSIRGDLLEADDVTILSGILAAIAGEDASWGSTGKDAVARLLTLILADADISTVVTAIAALE